MKAAIIVEVESDSLTPSLFGEWLKEQIEGYHELYDSVYFDVRIISGGVIEQ